PQPTRLSTLSLHAALPICEFAAMPGRVFGVAYNQDGSRIAAGGSSDGLGEVRVYNTADGAVVWKSEVAEGGIFTVDFSPDGKTRSEEHTSELQSQSNIVCR